jgi:hypothetical protein
MMPHRQEDIKNLKYVSSLPGQIPFIEGRTGGNYRKIAEHYSYRLFCN